MKRTAGILKVEIDDEGAMEIASRSRGAEDDETGPATFLEYWMDAWGVDLGAETNDFDGDGIINWVEYSMDSDPTNALSTGDVPVMDNDGGTLTYTYVKRNDDSSLSYTVESTTNLVSGSWTNAGGSAEVNDTVGALDEVLHSIPMDEPQSFIRLNTTK